jgi:hypothetical protein
VIILKEIKIKALESGREKKEPLGGSQGESWAKVSYNNSQIICPH